MPITKQDNKEKLLWIDQYGYKYWAKNRAELLRELGATKAQKIYRTIDMVSYHVGYLIRGQWLECFAPVYKPDKR